ncbi:unknown [Prevotella sp. CAG:592]|jgi:hypothetical protein|nr:unknown [Prevotella sp. CAG:592]
MKQLVHNKVVNKLWLFVNLGGKKMFVYGFNRAC